jgi:hypothetical protein
VQFVSSSSTSSSWKVVGNATYSAAGTYTVSVTVTDVDLSTHTFTDKHTTVKVTTPTPTSTLTAINSGAKVASTPVAIGGGLFFAATDSTHGTQLRTTVPSNFATMGSTLYFTARGATMWNLRPANSPTSTPEIAATAADLGGGPTTTIGGGTSQSASSIGALDFSGDSTGSPADSGNSSAPGGVVRIRWRR